MDTVQQLPQAGRDVGIGPQQVQGRGARAPNTHRCCPRSSRCCGGYSCAAGTRCLLAAALFTHLGLQIRGNKLRGRREAQVKRRGTLMRRCRRQAAAVAGAPYQLATLVGWCLHSIHSRLPNWLFEGNVPPIQAAGRRPERAFCGGAHRGSVLRALRLSTSLLRCLEIQAASFPPPFCSLRLVCPIPRLPAPVTGWM